MINNLAQGFLDAGFLVDMVIARAQGDHFDSIPEGVRQIRLGTKHTISGLPGLVSYLREHSPEALLAVKDRAIRVAIIARWLSGKKVRLVGRIGTTVSAALEGKSHIRKWGWRTGMRLFYKHADKIVAVSQGVAEDIRDITGLPEISIPTVPNPVITERIFTLSKEPLDHEWFHDHDTKVILGIGRLAYQKDFPTLIRAFAEVRKQVNCRLIILGEGGQRRDMESLVLDLGLTGDVQLPGFVANPYRWLARSSLFVLSSRWEGSPNALTEALALGTPVVSTDCPSGPREILCDGRYGTLVPMENQAAMAEAIFQTLHTRLPERTLREAVNDYTVKRSVKGYLEVFGLEES